MRWVEHYLWERYWFFYSLIKPNRCTSFLLIKPTFPSPPFPFQFLQSGDFVHFLGFSQPPAAGQPVKSMNEEKWSAFNFSLPYHHWIKSLSHRNKGNDHQFKNFLTVEQILLVSSIAVVKRTVWRIQVLIVGCKGIMIRNSDTNLLTSDRTSLPNLTEPLFLAGLPCSSSDYEKEFKIRVKKIHFDQKFWE